MTGPRFPASALRDYAGPVASAYPDEAINDALEAEVAAQANVCNVPEVTEESPMPPALDEALKRRVVRNLAMRSVPLGVQTDEVGGGIRLGSNDPEVRRLEGPYRKHVVG